MKNVQKANQPKRKLIIIVVIALLLVLIGTGLFAVKYAGVSGTAQDKAVLMYLRNDLESQEIGEFPDGVWYSGDETLFYDGKSSGTSTSYESFIVGPVNAQYMNVSFFGSTEGKWVSVTEFAAFRQ